jgi:RNA polymerase sigma-70 factor, ECF subfamily
MPLQLASGGPFRAPRRPGRILRHPANVSLRAVPPAHGDAAHGEDQARRDVLAAELAAACEAGDQASPETAAVREALRAAAAAWPAFALARPTFLQHLAGALLARDPADANARVAGLRLPDLYLACACLAGEPAALRALQDLLRALPQPARVAGGDAAFADDVRARVAERLLTGAAGRPPKLALYRGEGSLRGWLTVVAQRIALEMREAAGTPAARLDDFSSLLGGRCEPEVEMLRARFAPRLQAALQVAAGRLTERERLLLRLSLLQGLSTRQIAGSYRVNQSTVTRWIGRALDRLGQAVRESLRAGDGLGESEVDSLIAAVRSRVELSLTGLLAGGGEGGR